MTPDLERLPSLDPVGFFSETNKGQRFPSDMRLRTTGHRTFGNKTYEMDSKEPTKFIFVFRLETMR